MDLQRHLQQTYIRFHPQEAARYLESVPSLEAGTILSGTDTEDCARVMEFLVPGSAAKIIKSFPRQQGAEIIAVLDPACARSVLRQYDADFQAELLAQMKPPMGPFLRNSLKYPEYSAGSLADPRVLTLTRDITVGEAQSRIRVETNQAIYYLYVLDRNSSLCGVVLMKELMAGDPHVLVGSLMTEKVTAIPADFHIQDLLSHPAWQVFDSLPVVANGRYFLGALRYRALKKMTEAGPEESHPQFFSDTLLQLWEVYSLSGIELMTSLMDIFKTPTEQESSDTNKEAS